MSKDGIRVEEFSIYALGAEAVSYNLKDIHTLAMQVTREKIGGLALEFETELIYSGEGEPYLNIYVARGTKEEPENDRNLIVRPGDWFVILWDEIHLFRDKEFRSTFSFDGLSAPPAENKSVFTEGFQPNEEVLRALGATQEDIDEQKTLMRIAEPALQRFAEKRPPYVPTDAVPATDLETDKTVWLRPEAYESLDVGAKERFRLFEPAVRMASDEQIEALRKKMEAEKTRIVPAAGNLYPEGEGPDVDPETERKIGERIDSQPWMQQAKAELAEKDGGNTREQQL